MKGMKKGKIRNWFLKIFFIISILTNSKFLKSSHAQTQEQKEKEESETKSSQSPNNKNLTFDFHTTIQNIGYFKNDRDFDRSEPYYSTPGQTVGFAGTIFNPKFLLSAGKSVEIFYEAELGINLWSKNNPDEQNPVASDVFLLKHREIWSKIYLPGKKAGAKVGYQRFIDPTGLFFNHWIGAGSLFIQTGPSTWTLSFGEFPDTTYEGLEFSRNNFKHDTFMLSLGFDSGFRKLVKISGGVFGLIDTSIVGKPNTVFMPCLHLDYNHENFGISLSAALQAGVQENGSVEGKRVTNLGGALETHFKFNKKGFLLNLGVLILSPDDDYEGNEMNGAFLYSGKNSSMTRLMTENEARDVYDNYDEVMSAHRGAFYYIRSGLALIEASVQKRFFDFFEPGIVVSTFTTLNPENSLGYTWAGFEGDLLLNITLDENVALLTTFSTLIPGRALSSFVNEINIKATDPVFMLMGVLEAKI